MPYAKVPLVAKDPAGPPRALVVGRISTLHQPHENINASYRYVDSFMKGLCEGPIHYKHLGEQASGMRTDRVTIVEAEEEIATGTWDLVITEDLSRFYRNPRHQYAFVQDAVDHDTRVICIGDNLDTAEEGWEVALGTATLRHGLDIPDTCRRVRRTADHSFHNGGMVQKVRYGYRKLSAEEAASGGRGPRGLRIARAPDCTPVIREMARRVAAGAAYAAVADWLTDQGVAPGPYVTSGVWSGRLVEGLLRDPILHGTRTFRAVLGRTIYSTGRKKRRKNPDRPETEHYDELAHLSEEEHRELTRVMDGRAAANRRASGPGHPRYNRPRSRSVWPGQHPRCAACRELMYQCDDDHLKCKGSFKSERERPCWNHVQVRCPEVRDRVLSVLLGHCDQFPAFRRTLADAAWSELQTRDHHAGRMNRAAGEEVAALEKRAGNLTRAIEIGGCLDTLVRQLAGVEEDLKAAKSRREEQASAAEENPSWGSRDEVERQLGAALREVARTSYEFGDLMREVVPEFVIVPVQALDCGLVRPRAKLTIRLSAPAGGTDAAGPAPNPDDVAVVIDLFEPAAHIRAIPACVEARRADARLSLDKIAAVTGYGRMTVRRALAYSRLMAAAGMVEPYRELTERPASASRWRQREAR